MILEKVRQLIAEQMNIDESKITPDSDIIKDLGADSLDIVEMLMNVESEWGLVIDAEDEQDFFEKWTERESYVKFTGEGIAAIRDEIHSDAHFEHFDVFDGYHACVCTDQEQNIRGYELDLSLMD